MKSESYSQQELDFIFENHKLPRKELTMAFNQQFATNRSESAIKGVMSRNRWRNGRDGRFQKGQRPLSADKNKGKRFSKKTEFKSGHKPHNWVPVGSSRIRPDGFHELKIAEPNVWKEKHRILWEEHNGPIPKGMCIKFVDGDKDKIELDNLVMLSRSELARLNQNGFSGAPAELKPTILALSRLQAAAHGRDSDNRAATD